MLQHPFCLKPFGTYHNFSKFLLNLQRRANRLSQAAVVEGKQQWELPRSKGL